MTALPQLVLPFPDAPQYAAADFLRAPSNAEALAWIGDASRWPDGRLALWGEEGCGKTHLLSLWAARAGGPVLAGAGLHGVPAVPSGAGVAIDEADSLNDEAALLHLLNAAQEVGRPVLMASRLPPSRWPLRLPDLASRVRSAAAVRIRPLDDALLPSLLARLLAGRQLAVAEGVQDWLLRRLPRTPAALREAAAALDRAALSAGMAVSRAMAARVIESLESGSFRQKDEIVPKDGEQASSWGREVR